MVCCFCGGDKELIQAHIVPKRLCTLLNEAGKAAVMTSADWDYSKRLPQGPYDKNILCAECEKLFGPIDQFGIKSYFEIINKLDPVYDKSELLGWRVGGIDLDRFAQFLVAILWRAGVSNNPMFRRVTLGPYVTQLKEVVRSGCKYADYPFFVRKLKNKVGERSLFDPYAIRFMGLRCYLISLPGYVFVLKLDKQKTPQYFMTMTNPELLILPDSYVGERETPSA